MKLKIMPLGDSITRGSILAHFRGRLLVATIPPQCPPREGFEQVAAYNAALPPLVAALQGDGHAVTLVDVHAALTPADLLPDGVHPNAGDMKKIAEAWWGALSGVNGVTASRGHEVTKSASKGPNHEHHAQGESHDDATCPLPR
jgi:hypothetical protein